MADLSSLGRYLSETIADARSRLNPNPQQPGPLDERVKAVTDRLGRAGMTALNAITDPLAVPGDVYAGRFATEPEAPGRWSDQDEARAQINQREMTDRAFDLAALITGGTYAGAPAVENSVGMAVTRKIGPQGRPAVTRKTPPPSRAPSTIDEALDNELAGGASGRSGVQAFLNRRDALRASIEGRMTPEQLTAFREAYPEGSMNFPGPAQIEAQFGKLQTPVAVSKTRRETARAATVDDAMAIMADPGSMWGMTSLGDLMRGVR
ncbi:hypothetical protein RA307_04775 [Xanthobacteraceae bacterium Astr-EGSB]|uniref:hypothetical protein n=1 Tax=Astrobacterium formosum TaxID=3069710 RepID=UPI0027AFAFD5|nr:hypothetical protein [Xanthobacteraceae bacterium Astr-EGSB]